MTFPDDSPHFSTVNTRFRHIGDRLRSVWGTPALSELVGSLLLHSKGGSRQGFPLEVEEALCALIEEHASAVAMERKLTVRDKELLLLTRLPAFSVIDQRFTRIANIIRDMWGSELFVPYVNKLIQESKDGPRMGFPQEVGEALISLVVEHGQAFPQVAAQETDFWSAANFK